MRTISYKHYRGIYYFKRRSVSIFRRFFWAAHILLIDRFTRKFDALKLSLLQYMFCSSLSLIVAFISEDINLNNIVQASVPILYGGIGSVGIAYTLQIYGQKYARPSHAVVILSLESVFAAIGEFLILGETMSFQGLHRMYPDACRCPDFPVGRH